MSSITKRMKVQANQRDRIISEFTGRYLSIAHLRCRRFKTGYIYPALTR